MLFANRAQAGRALASQLTGYAGRPDVVILALPRGGVPVAYEVALQLHVPMDVFVVRKLGVPGHSELAMGALASGGVRVLNKDVLDSLGIPGEMIDAVTERERPELERREHLYRAGRPLLPVEGRIIILIDDGLATGSTMRAAASALRRQAPQKIVVAVPVAPRSVREEFVREVDEVVCAETPEPFHAVGNWYRDFAQTTDKEVRELLERAEALSRAGA
ncbi:MAG TPA: phosphoribosyltransferase [Acidobacteriota bacterium]|jgi:predicted phosphoribosyltransferase